ncbi:MAG: squalene synthase HpnD [Candidatus Rokuibacteriota bacterium]|nr:MAG: squalene synthase HpnD [Candidatus Rokubacteria bacterium]
MNGIQFVSTLTRKSRSSFYYAFLFLPRPRREALYAVYAFCRIVDDVADLGSNPARQRAALNDWRAEVARCYAGRALQTPVARRLADAVRAYPIPRTALESIIDGVEMDLDRATYETFEELYPYCYRVASAVGLCCIEIFGYAESHTRDYAVNLGIALQLTNIMRDVETDARAGRVYIPQEDLRRFGVTSDDLRAGRYTDAFVALMEHQARRARHFYEAAQRAFPAADARALVAAQIMGRIYFALLRELEARRFRIFGRHVALSARRKLGIALRTWAAVRLGMAP